MNEDVEHLSGAIKGKLLMAFRLYRINRQLKTMRSGIEDLIRNTREYRDLPLGDVQGETDVLP